MDCPRPAGCRHRRCHRSRRLARPDKGALIPDIAIATPLCFVTSPKLLNPGDVVALEISYLGNSKIRLRDFVAGAGYALRTTTIPSGSAK